VFNNLLLVLPCVGHPAGLEGAVVVIVPPPQLYFVLLDVRNFLSFRLSLYLRPLADQRKQGSGQMYGKQNK